MKQPVKKDFYRKKLIYATSWFMFFIIVAVVVAIVFSFTPDNQKKEVSIRLKSADDTSVAELVTESVASNTNMFIECNEFDIRRLIRDYYEAIECGDRNELSKYVDDVSGFTDDFLNNSREYVEGYMDIQCYYMEGMMPGTYLVVAYSYIKYRDINATVPNIDKFYVCSNASNLYYISKKDVGEEITAYNELMFDNSQITQMYEMEEREKENAIKYDSSVKDMLEKFN